MVGDVGMTVKTMISIKSKMVECCEYQPYFWSEQEQGYLCLSLGFLQSFGILNICFIVGQILNLMVYNGFLLKFLDLRILGLEYAGSSVLESHICLST